MPDQLNKQTLINLLIDSPLREPIKINLVDIVNNTSDPDLPKVYSTITKELEIFQKATERRMKLAEETIAKLGGTTSTTTPPLHIENDSSREMTPGAQQPGSPTPPPLNLPPMPTPPVSPSTINDLPSIPPALSVPPLDLPPLPTSPTLHIENDSSREMTPGAQQLGSPLPTPTPLGGIPQTPQGDEAALAEIQKELDSLKTATATDVASAASPTPKPIPTPSPAV